MSWISHQHLDTVYIPRDCSQHCGHVSALCWTMPWASHSQPRITIYKSHPHQQTNVKPIVVAAKQCIMTLVLLGSVATPWSLRALALCTMQHIFLLIFLGAKSMLLFSVDGSTGPSGHFFNKKATVVSHIANSEILFFDSIFESAQQKKPEVYIPVHPVSFDSLLIYRVKIMQKLLRSTP